MTKTKDIEPTTMLLEHGWRHVCVEQTEETRMEQRVFRDDTKENRKHLPCIHLHCY